MTMMNEIWITIITFSTLGLVFGLILGYADFRFTVSKHDSIIEKIDAILPQSQCGQCGYPGCQPYAEAISVKEEKINRCVPGGSKVMLNIAALLNIQPQSIADGNKAKKPTHMIAIINEPSCIGCSKCIQACPVDAIVGTKHTMHTVIANLCTGCKLCIHLCPTKCIELRLIKTTLGNQKSD